MCRTCLQRAAIGLGILVLSAMANAAMARDAAVHFTIRDPSGQPVPFVTLWSTHASTRGEPEFSLEDLWSAALRHADSFEYVHEYSRPMERLRVPPMSDGAGHARDRIASEYLAVRGAGPVRVPYVLMRRGYLPEKREVDIGRGRSLVRVDVVLQPDPARTAAEPAYLAAFDRVRAELSDWRRNAEVSTANPRRLEMLRSQLEQAAEHALGENDHAVAARIYGRMETLPAILLVDGKAVGFQQSDVESPRSRSALARALELDADADDFLRMRAYLERRRAVRKGMSVPMSAADVQALASFLEREQSTFDRLEGRFWIVARIGHVYDLASVGRDEEAESELARIERDQPRGEDYTAYRNYLRRRREAMQPRTAPR